MDYGAVFLKQLQGQGNERPLSILNHINNHKFLFTKLERSLNLFFDGAQIGYPLVLKEVGLLARVE